MSDDGARGRGGEIRLPAVIIVKEVCLQTESLIGSDSRPLIYRIFLFCPFLTLGLYNFVRGFGWGYKLRAYILKDS